MKTTTFKVLSLLQKNKTTDWYDTVEIEGVTCRQSLVRGHITRLHAANYYDIIVVGKKGELHITNHQLRITTIFLQVDKKYHADVEEE